MRKLFFYIIVVLAGGMSTMQAPVNAQLRLHFTNDPILAALVSYFVSGLLMLILALVLRAPGPTWKFGDTKVWNWLGGVAGACYVCIMMVAVVQIGNAAATGVLVFGQLLIGAVLDQFGLLGLKVRKVSGQRLAGIGLVLGGVLLVFNF